MLKYIWSILLSRIIINRASMPIRNRSAFYILPRSRLCRRLDLLCICIKFCVPAVLREISNTPHINVRARKSVFRFCLNQAFSIILGGILYAFVYDTTLLHKCFYWTNPECGSYSLNFVPQLDVFRLETNAFMVYATCFSLPYIVKILIKRIKILISKN